LITNGPLLVLHFETAELHLADGISTRSLRTGMLQSRIWAFVEEATNMTMGEDFSAWNAFPWPYACKLTKDRLRMTWIG
jgi:hypothetical protein